MICISKKIAEEFKKALKGKDIQISDLLKMTTETRTALFEKYSRQGEVINNLFEKKLVLKNKVAGLKNLLSQISQEGRYNPAKKAELAKLLEEYKAKQQERIFNPSEEQTFLNSLADEFSGTHITKAEAKELFTFTSAVDKLKENFDGEKWVSEKAGKEYGAAKVIMENYVNSLKEGDVSIKGLASEAMVDFKETFKTNSPKAIYDLFIKTLKTISDNSISFVASLDNSFIGRQGLKTLMTHPSVWWKGAKNSFSDMAKTMGGQNMKDALMADIYSNPNYLKGNYELAKILPKVEEQYPTSFPERVPFLGRVFKASQVAFEGSAIRMRTGLYDLVSNIAEKNGVDITDKYQIQSMGKMINSLTARGQWGKTGEPTIVRLLLWAPKMLKANLDVLTAHAGQDISVFARKQAAINLVKIIATSAGIMTLANAIKPGSAEIDPRSSNFGKIKVGNTTFDYTGGAGSLIVLASRWLTNSSKRTTTGLVREFGTGYGQQTRFDTLIDFLVGKTTPPIGAMIAFAKGTTPTGEKATIGRVARNVALPISLQNAIELKDDNSVEAILGVILDTIGINTNTYIAGTSDWTQNPGVELQAFQKKVGEEKFKQANKEYNKQVSDWLLAVRENPKYKALSAEDKQKVITKKKDEIKTRIFARHGFGYKQAKSKPLPKF